MGSLYGTHEIIELKDEHNLINTEKKPRGGTKALDEDINKLFEAINIRNSFNGFSLSDDINGSTPRRNLSKKPMRMSTSSSSGYSEPLSLKQALRGLCISHASEMAAIKRLSMPPGSPALSDSGKLADLYKSVVKASESCSSIAKDKEIESTSSSSRMIPQYPRDPKMKSYSKSAKSSPQLNPETSTKRQPESGNQFSINEPVQEKKIILVKNINNCATKNDSTPRRATPKSRYKGKSARPVKTTIRSKTLVKKKSKRGLTSDPITSTAKSPPEISQLVCQRCHCSLKEPNQDSVSKNVSFLNNNKNPKHKDKWDFTQSSNSSVCEYSISTSISEDRNLGTCIIGNRPHMSKDIKWQAINQMIKQNGFLGLRHFNLLKKLGCGDIGTVYLAELIGTNCPFAIKVMDNEFLERRQKMPRAHMEKDILSILDHPFLPTLYAHFVSENLSCLVMEYCPGGDLHVLRQKQPGKFFHEQAARFYVAEVLLALEYLHMLGIIYRDLKPENILVRQDGHIMVTDFDLSLRCTVNPFLLEPSSSGPIEPPRVSGPCAGSNCIDPFCMKPTCQVTCFRPRVPPAPKARKKTNPGPLPQLVAEPTEARSNSFVGTHEYLAPEIIKGEGHGSSVDWWTFGVFLYELLYGRTPFKGLGNDDTLANVVLESLRFPETPLVSFHARDLIKGLLVKEPENRIGSKRGAAEIKKHPFFDGLNWALIRCVAPPELPEPYDVTSSESGSLEKAKKYLDYNGSTGGHLEFELF